MNSSPAPTLDVRGLRKSFGPVKAVRDVSFSVDAGEIVGLLGDNGAGKSTVIKCLAGVHGSDGGEIYVHGREAEIASPDSARAAGIETVFQDLALVPQLNVVQNLFLDREQVRGWFPARQLGVLDKKSMQHRTEEILAGLNIRIPSVRQLVETLSGGQRQAIAVGRAAEWSRDLVLLDEPTAAVGVEQSATILDLMRTLRDKGLSIVFISHNMQQVTDICDRAVVLRRGESVADVQIADVGSDDLVGLITGSRTE